ncbi:MAG: endonuclease [Acidobacteriota bacterium]
MIKFRAALALAGALCVPAFADTTPQALPFSQNWSNTGAITTNDDWSGVPGIVGYQGADPGTTGAPYNPQTFLVFGPPVDVIANQTNPNTQTTGGVAEFDSLANPVVALQGSGTADAPHVTLHLDTTGDFNITVRYNLRDVDGSADNAIQPVSLQYRIGGAGDFTDFPGAFVADATSGPSQATLVTPVCAVLPVAVEDEPLVEVRMVTGNAVGSDEWVGIDDIVVDSSGCGGVLPALSIDDVQVAEGNSGTTTASFTVSLSQPAGIGGVIFDIATQNGTATAGSDYVARSETSQSIPQGSSDYQFDVTVNGDTAIENNETFLVNVTNISGASIGDAQGEATILNDDAQAIHDVQGPGAASPLVGQAVTVEGLVTARRANGFFLQAPDAEVDADPATSEGIFVFTSAAPPAAASVGARVRVSGTVVEFVPPADPQQPPLTEISSPTVVQLSAGPLPLPTPVVLSTTFPDPAGVHDQMERVEGMRVSVPSFTVTAPTLGSINEVNATATTNGVLFGTVTGVPRAFREPGVQLPDTLPAGSPANVPRFDTNPEVIRVDTDGQVPPAPWSPLDARTGAVINGLTGVVDYAFRTYTILPDPVAAAVTPGTGPSPVTPPAAGEVTVASFNVLRLFDTVNDPTTSDPVLTPAAFDRRLSKISLAVRDYLLLPDILAVQEVENLTALQALAGQINADVIAGGSPSPEYVAYLSEGNDVGGIDVGFLVRTAPVNPPSGPDRVEVTSVTQIGASSVVVDPDPNQPDTDLLNDRPPLVLQAIVNQVDGTTFPLTVLVVHQRSLNGIASEEPETACCGWTTVGQRVRAKRFQQANFLGAWLQTRQTTGAAETRRVLALGDFNAFAFNDGFVDTMGFLTATPAPNDQTVIPGDGFSTLSPGLSLASDSGAAQGYSYTFDGDAQAIDHALATAALASVAGITADHARIDADFPAVSYGVDATAERASDHDPLLVVLVPILFRDGFETGGTTLWSAAQP